MLSKGDAPPPLVLPIHHFPLAYNGDLSDCINEAYIQPNSGFTWDSTHDMYRMTVSTRNASAYIKGVDLGQTIGRPVENLTICMTLKIFAASSGYFGLFALSFYGIIYTTAAPLNTLVKVVYRYNGGGINDMFVNGVKVQTFDLSTNPTVQAIDNTQITLGWTDYSAGSGNALISNVQIHDRPLTQQEIENY